MKKIIYSTLALLSCSMLANAQDIGALLVTMPDNMIVGVSVDQKKELAVAESDSLEKKIFVINSIGEEVVRTASSDDFLSLKTSEAGSLQIKKLPLVNDSYILAVVTTVCDTVCDSQIDFYTTKWQPLNKTALFPAITKDDFFKKDIDRSSLDYVNAVAPLDMTFIKMDMDQSGSDLTVTFDIENYLSKEDYKKLKPYLKDKPLKLHWDKFAYKLQE